MFKIDWSKWRVRHKKLTFWNKVGFWGSVSSILGIIISIIFGVYTLIQNENNAEQSIDLLQQNNETKIETNDRDEYVESFYGRIELADLLTFFLDEKGEEDTTHSWDYGTTGDLSSVKWKKKSGKDQHREYSVKRSGYVFILVNGLINIANNSDTTSVPWLIELIGSAQSKWGYEEIHLDSGRGKYNSSEGNPSGVLWEEPMKQVLSSMGSEAISNQCAGYYTPSSGIVIWTINNKKYEDASLVESYTCGSYGCEVHIYLYPFISNLSCDKLVKAKQKTYKLEGYLWPGRADLDYQGELKEISNHSVE